MSDTIITEESERDGHQRRAILSLDRRYRYRLTHTWASTTLAPDQPLICWEKAPKNLLRTAAGTNLKELDWYLEDDEVKL